MHENDTAGSSPTRRRGGLFGLARRTAASWSERASNEASSALAPAPGAAEAERAGRQRAPEPGEEGDEPSTAPSADNAEQPAADSAAPRIELPADRRPPLEQLLARARRPLSARADEPQAHHREARPRQDIRFTASAVRVINAEAERRGQRFAGFVGDAALAVALGKANVVGSPEDDPARPLLEAIEAHTRALTGSAPTSTRSRAPSTPAPYPSAPRRSSPESSRQPRPVTN